MEKRTPFFLTRLFRRIPQNSQFSEAKGWEDTADDTRFNGWDDSSPGSSISGVKTYGWSDEPPENDYNGWGSVTLPRSRTPEATTKGWEYEKSKDEYNGWGSGSGSGSKGRSSAVRSGGWMDELPEGDNNGWDVPESAAINDGQVCEKPKDEYNGWDSGSGSGSGGKGQSSAVRSSGWMDEVPEGDYNGWGAPESNPVSQQVEIAKSTPLEVESWAPAPPPLPSAPPIPDGGFSENPAANDGGNGGASCVVCWEAPVEGACVPCGHMASCMTCLHAIESRNGTCPICRSKIDKVIRIYAISTK